MKHTFCSYRLSVFAVCALLALGMAAQSVQAQTLLDFEFLSNPNNAMGYNAQGLSITQNGFTVSVSAPIRGLNSIAPDGGNVGFNYTGSVALINGAFLGMTTVTQNNGAAFTLNSIDLANDFLQSRRVARDTVNFIGTLQGGGTVTQSFTLEASDALQNFTFGAEFTNLISVSFRQDSPYNQFDNIVVTAVPSPASLPIFGGGLLLLINRRRQKRKER